MKKVLGFFAVTCLVVLTACVAQAADAAESAECSRRYFYSSSIAGEPVIVEVAGTCRAVDEFVAARPETFTEVASHFGELHRAFKEAMANGTFPFGPATRR